MPRRYGRQTSVPLPISPDETTNDEIVGHGTELATVVAHRGVVAEDPPAVAFFVVKTLHDTQVRALRMLHEHHIARVQS